MVCGFLHNDTETFLAAKKHAVGVVEYVQVLQCRKSNRAAKDSTCKIFCHFVFAEIHGNFDPCIKYSNKFYLK